MSKSLSVLRSRRFDSAADALVVAAAVGRLGRPGSATLVFLDDDARVVDVLVISDGGDQLAHVLDLALQMQEPELEELFVITDRTGEVPADRPDDELVWMELSDLASSYGVCLLDWYVVFDMQAFSVAEFAPSPARW